MPPSIILTVNTGSSSVRLAAFSESQDELLPLAREHLDAEAGTPEELGVITGNGN